MNNTLIEQVKSQDDIKVLYNTMAEIYKEFLPNIFSNEIISYIFHLLNQNSLKNEIELDDKYYYLIKIKSKIAGFFEFSYKNTFSNLEKIYLYKNFRRKRIAKKVLGFVYENARSKNCTSIIASINKANTIAIDFFKKEGFNFTETNAKYIGSDIYLFEDFYSKIM